MSQPCNKHLCIEDLEPYIKRNDYFKDYTDAEKQEILKNLGISKLDLLNIINLLSLDIVYLTYLNFINMISNKELSPGRLYAITDFQTIYELNGEVKSDTYNYTIICLAISTDAINSNVHILSNPSWEVKYDYTPRVILDTLSKGTITYLKDSNGNSAYFDFKNITLSDGQLSLIGKCYDITLGKNCSNIRLSNCNNITIGRGCSNINLENVSNCIINPNISNINQLIDTTATKSIQLIDGKTIVSYLDSDTLIHLSYII